MFLVIVLIGKELPLPCTAQLAFADISNFSRDLWPFFPPAAFNSLSFALFPSQKQLRTASLGDFKHNSQATYDLVLCPQSMVWEKTTSSENLRR